MTINENYNSAVQKYGKSIVEQFLNNGLPPKYLLSACRFHEETNISLINLVELFNYWNKYVCRYNNGIDVNKENYDSFARKIKEGQLQHIVPNVLWYDSECSIGRLDSLKDVRCLPQDTWCISARSKYEQFVRMGHKFYVIYSPNKPRPFTFIIADVHDGEVEYYDMRNYKYSYLHQNDNFKNLESSLPIELRKIIYNEAANQIENKEQINCNKNMAKQRIRLTESDLHRIIKESARRILKEETFSSENTQDSIVMNLMDIQNTIRRIINARHGYYVDVDEITLDDVMKELMEIDKLSYEAIEGLKKLGWKA